MTMRYTHLSQDHKKKAVEAASSALNGHLLDTKAEKAVEAKFGEGAQAPESIGAGGGNRTLMGARPGGF
jgi:hypothetical protein